MVGSTLPKPYGLLRRVQGAVWDVAFSPDGKLIAMGGEKTVKLWHKDGRLLEKFCKAHKGIAYGIAWSPDGKILATASTDGTVKLWQPNGVLVRTLKLDGSPFWNVAFSPDGEALPPSVATALSLSGSPMALCCKR